MRLRAGGWGGQCKRKAEVGGRRGGGDDWERGARRGDCRLWTLRIGHNVNTLWTKPIQVCISYSNRVLGG